MVKTKRRIASKPISQPLPVAADQWVAEGGLDPEVDSLPQAPKRSVESQYTSLLLSQIRQREQDTRPLNPKHVEALVESIAVLGLIEPLVVDQAGTLVAGGHRLAALRRLQSDRHQEYRQHFPADTVPIRMLLFKVEDDPDLALQIEIAENEQRRDYTPGEIRAIADRLQNAGYMELKGRPKQGQRALMPALSVVVGKNIRTVQRYLSPEPENGKSEKSTTSVVLLQQALVKLRKWQQIEHGTQKERELETVIFSLMQKIEDALVD
jgi:ParB family transcriptional regulator, chromosome partitioning protein